MVLLAYVGGFFMCGNVRLHEEYSRLLERCMLPHLGSLEGEYTTLCVGQRSLCRRAESRYALERMGVSVTFSGGALDGLAEAGAAILSAQLELKRSIMQAACRQGPIITMRTRLLPRGIHSRSLLVATRTVSFGH